jgi:hypothetical protein
MGSFPAFSKVSTPLRDMSLLSDSDDLPRQCSAIRPLRRQADLGGDRIPLSFLTRRPR